MHTLSDRDKAKTEPSTARLTRYAHSTAHATLYLVAQRAEKP